MVNNYYLQYFVDAVKHKSLTKASKENFVSVSAISQGIQGLEKQFDLELVTHKRNNFELTPQGHQFYEQALELLDEVKHFNAQIKMNQKKMIGRVEFATQQSFASVLLPDILIQLQAEFPAMQPFFKMGITADVRKWVSEKELDFGVALGSVRAPNTKMTEIYKGEFVLIKKKGVKKNLKYLITGEFKEVTELKKKYKKHYKKDLPVEMYIESWGVLTKMALKGLGIGFIPDYYLRGIDPKEYTICRTPLDLPKYVINAYKHKDKKITPQGYRFFERFVELVQEVN